MEAIVLAYEFQHKHVVQSDMLKFIFRYHIHRQGDQLDGQPSSFIDRSVNMSFILPCR